MVDVHAVYSKEKWFDLVNAYAKVAQAPMVVLDEKDHVIVMSGSARERFAEAEVWDDIREQWGLRTPPLFVPVTLHDETLAQVVAFPADTGRRTKLVVELLAGVIETRAYHEYEVNNLSQEILDKYEEVNLLYDLSDALGAIFETRRVYDIVLERGIAVIGVEQAAILIYDPKSQSLRLVAGHGLPAEVIGRYQVRLGQGVAGTVAMTGEGLLVDKVAGLPGSAASTEADGTLEKILRSPLICAPIQAKDRMIGVITMGSKHGGQMFTAGDLKLLSAIASLAAVSLYNSQLVAELRDSERVRRELEIAESIQISLLPKGPPEIPGVDLAGRCVSATNVGGDYYDFFLRPDGSLGVAVADVSGHSVGAALMMAVARSAIRSEAKHAESPAEVLRLVNDTLYEDLDRSELFISIFFALYDPRSHELRFANAGHCPPLLCTKTRGCRRMDADGMLIGVLPQVGFELGHAVMGRGDVAVLYTDGLIEAENRNGERYGETRLHRLIDQVRTGAADQILDAIFADMNEFVQDQVQADDVTVVVIKAVEN